MKRNDHDINKMSLDRANLDQTSPMNEHTSAAPFVIRLSMALWQCQALAISPSWPRHARISSRARSILNKLARIALKPNSISNVNQQFHSTVRTCMYPLFLSVERGNWGRVGDGGCPCSSGGTAAYARATPRSNPCTPCIPPWYWSTSGGSPHPPWSIEFRPCGSRIVALVGTAVCWLIRRWCSWRELEPESQVRVREREAPQTKRNYPYLACLWNGLPLPLFVPVFQPPFFPLTHSLSLSLSLSLCFSPLLRSFVHTHACRRRKTFAW